MAPTKIAEGRSVRLNKYRRDEDGNPLRMIHGQKRVFKPGEEEELLEVIPDEDRERLERLGVLVEDDGEEEGPTGRTSRATPSTDPRIRRAMGGGLPDGFPAKDDLEAGGFTSVDQVKAASDDELLAVSGVGDVTLKRIRNTTEPEAESEPTEGEGDGDGEGEGDGDAEGEGGNGDGEGEEEGEGQGEEE